MKTKKNWLTIILSIVAILITIFQASIAYFQYNISMTTEQSAQRLIEDNRKNNRAYLRVSGLYIKPEERQIRVGVKIKNSGNSPAFQISTYLGIGIVVNESDWNLDVDRYKPIEYDTILSPNSEYQTESSIDITQAVLNELETKPPIRTLYCFGTLIYYDIYERKRCLNWRTRYDFQLKDFVLSDDGNSVECE